MLKAWDSPDVLMSGVVPNIPHFNAWPVPPCFTWFERNIRKGRAWLMQTNQNLFQHPVRPAFLPPSLDHAGWVLSGHHSLLHPPTPRVSWFSGSHPGADRDCPQWPGHRPRPEESFRPALCMADALLPSRACSPSWIPRGGPFLRPRRLLLPLGAVLTWGA